MDISDYIKFNPKRERDGLPSKVPVYRVYNRPLTILKWEIKSSQFADGSGSFVEITAQPLYGDTRIIRFNTGSKVIISQLEEITKAMNQRKVMDRTFTCVLRSYSNFIKLLPLNDEQTQPGKENSK